MSSKDTNPKDAIGAAKWRQFMVVPRQVLWEVGVGMLEGALKYGRHNYRGAGVRASVYCDAAIGHIDQFIEGEDIDQDSGLPHITKAICSLVVLRDAMMNDFWTDDRPPKIHDLEGLRDRLQAMVEANFERHKDKNPHHYTETDDPAPYVEFGVGEVFKDIDDAPATTADLLRALLGDNIKVDEDERDPKMRVAKLKKLNGQGIEWAGLVDDQIDLIFQWSGMKRGDNVVEDAFRARRWALNNGLSEALLSAGTALDTEPRGGTDRTDPDFREAVRLLRDPTWLPGPLRGLELDDPRYLERMHPDDPEYDRTHIVEGLTWCQLDRLTAREAENLGMRGLPAGEEQLCNSLLRRVFVRIKDRPLMKVRIIWPDGGESIRVSRLSLLDWNTAIPGTLVSSIGIELNDVS